MRTGRSAKWTDEDRAIVRDQYTNYGPNIPALLGKYSSRAIEMCAYRQGIRTREFWTDNEDKFILDQYPMHGGEIHRLMPGRSRVAVVTRAARLGVRQGILPEWTPSEGVRNVDIAYLAGFIDGEGTISINRVSKGRYIKARVGYCNSNENVVRFCAQITGSKVLLSHRPDRRHSDIYLVNICAREKVLGVLKTIRPYLIAKKAQADAVIEFLEMQEYRIGKGPPSDREIELERICEKLNVKGRKRIWAAP
jgi:hypothetical protein